MPFCNKCGEQQGGGGKAAIENIAAKIHKQRLAIAICAAAGMFSVFMPWVNSPLSKKLFGNDGFNTELTSNTGKADGQNT